MGGSCLESLSILHHGLDGHGVQGSCEPFIRTFMAHNYRKRHPVAREIGIDIHHLGCLGNCLLLSGMGSVTLLPEKLGGPQEKTGTHFPANNICPLVAQNRKIAP